MHTIDLNSQRTVQRVLPRHLTHPRRLFGEFPEMAPEAYIGLAGDIVKTVAPHTESDPTGLLAERACVFW